MAYLDSFAEKILPIVPKANEVFFDSYVMICIVDTVACLEYGVPI